MWRTCPNAKAVPGVRVAYTDEREIQHAHRRRRAGGRGADGRSVEEGKARATGPIFPPLGRRSNGGGQAFDAEMWGNVPGGYRNTINDNVVLIEMIETLEGAEGRRRDRQGPGRDRGVRGQRRSRQLLGLPAGHARLRAAINIVHDAAIKAGKRLCGPFAWRDRPDFTCFQAGSETAAIARGVAAELGNR